MNRRKYIITVSALGVKQGLDRVGLSVGAGGSGSCLGFWWIRSSEEEENKEEKKKKREQRSMGCLRVRLGWLLVVESKKKKKKRNEWKEGKKGRGEKNQTIELDKKPKIKPQKKKLTKNN